MERDPHRESKLFWQYGLLAAKGFQSRGLSDRVRCMRHRDASQIDKSGIDTWSCMHTAILE